MKFTSAPSGCGSTMTLADMRPSCSPKSSCAGEGFAQVLRVFVEVLHRQAENQPVDGLDVCEMKRSAEQRRIAIGRAVVVGKRAASVAVAGAHRYAGTDLDSSCRRHSMATVFGTFNSP